MAGPRLRSLLDKIKIFPNYLDISGFRDVDIDHAIGHMNLERGGVDGLGIMTRGQ